MGQESKGKGKPVDTTLGLDVGLGLESFPKEKMTVSGNNGILEIKCVR